jgi:hypothetical protein
MSIPHKDALRLCGAARGSPPIAAMELEGKTPPRIVPGSPCSQSRGAQLALGPQLRVCLGPGQEWTVVVVVYKWGKAKTKIKLSYAYYKN